LLANIWDPVGARVVQSAGMRAIATASAAAAPSHGYEDRGHLPADVAFTALRRITEAVTLPVTADLENGYGLPPEEIVDRLIEAGACGLNLEDTDHAADALVDAEEQADRIAAIRSAASARGVDLVINARVDVHLRERPIEEGLERARKYFDAGADCVYPILLWDVAAIRDYVALGPTNVLWRPGGVRLGELVAANVARISVGPLLHQLVMKRLTSATIALRCLDDE